MAGITGREIGPVGAALADPRVYIELIADGIHVDPTLIRTIFAAAPGRVVLVTDAMAAAASAPGSYSLGGLSVEVDADGRAVLAGSDDARWVHAHDGSRGGGVRGSGRASRCGDRRRDYRSAPCDWSALSPSRDMSLSVALPSATAQWPARNRSHAAAAAAPRPLSWDAISAASFRRGCRADGARSQPVGR